MAQHIAFVTGGNRGLGFEFVKQLAARGSTVIATFRNERSAENLLSFCRNNNGIYAIQADVTRAEDIKRAAEFVSHTVDHLDLLICNAGINLKYNDGISAVTASDLMESFRVNVTGPFLCAEAFISLLGKSTHPRIINISSQMGSISRSGGNAVPYRISKAALNMLTKNQAENYGDKGIVTIALHPGWVKTDMGGSNAPLSPTESVEQMLEVIDGLTKKNNGEFLSHTGRKLDY